MYDTRYKYDIDSISEKIEEVNTTLCNLRRGNYGPLEEDEFFCYLNDTYGEIIIEDIPLYPSDILEQCNPTGYVQAKKRYFSNRIEGLEAELSTLQANLTWLEGYYNYIQQNAEEERED